MSTPATDLQRNNQGGGSVRVSSWVATILFLLFSVTIVAFPNTSGHFAPESSPQSGFLCTFNSFLSSSTITPGTPSVTVSGTDTCDPAQSYMWAALYSESCYSIKSYLTQVGYTYLWTHGPPSISYVRDFTLTDSSGQFTGNYPTSSLTPGDNCILLQVPCFWTIFYFLFLVPIPRGVKLLSTMILP